MIDLTRENPVTFDAAPALVPEINGVAGMDARRKLNSRTIYNWANKGKRGVVLEAISIGGILCTTQEALFRFFQRLSSVREERILNQRHTGEPEAHRQRRQTSSHNQKVRAKLLRDHGV